MVCLISLFVPLIKPVLSMETSLLSCTVSTSIYRHIHCISIVSSSLCCFHLMLSYIQLSILIKGPAHSHRACLIFHSLSHIKKEGTYKLEHV